MSPRAPRIGILGGGQLGRMLALAGYPLGLRFRVADPSPDAPAGQLAEHVHGFPETGEACRRFTEGLDVITYEWENIPVELVRALEANVPVFPDSKALEASQDRLREKRFFQSLGLPTPPFASVESWDELKEAVARIGFPIVLKTRRMGYDGRGQVIVSGWDDLEAAWAKLGSVPLIAEGWIAFRREVSLLAVRSRTGERAFYPLVENEHPRGMLGLSRAPAPDLAPEIQELAEGYARAVLDALDYVGVLAIEFFECGGAGERSLILNEMAPRVHNSGHWSIEGAATSQFENHLRAILGLPLGSTAPLGHSAMLNLIGELPPRESLLRNRELHLHLYDKAPAPGRKLGHVTLVDPDPVRLEERLAPVRRLVEACRVYAEPGAL